MQVYSLVPGILSQLFDLGYGGGEVEMKETDSMIRYALHTQEVQMIDCKVCATWGHS